MIERSWVQSPEEEKKKKQKTEEIIFTTHSIAPNTSKYYHSTCNQRKNYFHTKPLESRTYFTRKTPQCAPATFQASVQLQVVERRAGQGFKLRPSLAGRRTRSTSLRGGVSRPPQGKRARSVVSDVRSRAGLRFPSATRPPGPDGALLLLL